MMKSFKRIGIWGLAVALCLALFSGCGKEDPSSSSGDAGQGSSTPSVALNPFTGLPIEEDSYLTQRPVAIMINNIKQAQPLVGISDADMLFEITVEGGITRMMAVSQDPTQLGDVGSVRSARPYFVHIAKSLDALYIHVGGSEEAKSLLSNYDGNMEFINGGYDGIWWRDSWRRQNLGYEHSVLTNGGKIQTFLEESSMRTELASGSAYHQLFSEESPVLQGEAATSMHLKFSGYKSSDLTYQPEKKTYLFSQFGNDLVDSNESAVTFTNVLALHIDSWVTDSYGHLALDLVGSGDGYYMSNGKAIPIQWSRASEDAPFVYTTATGEELAMLPGNTYVGIVPSSDSISIAAQ